MSETTNTIPRNCCAGGPVMTNPPNRLYAELTPHCGSCAHYENADNRSECQHPAFISDSDINSVIEDFEMLDETPQRVAEFCYERQTDESDWLDYNMVCDLYSPKTDAKSVRGEAHAEFVERCRGRLESFRKAAELARQEGMDLAAMTRERDELKNMLREIIDVVGVDVFPGIAPNATGNLVSTEPSPVEIVRCAVSRLRSERDALAAWQCAECGALFADTTTPVLLDGVTRCSGCVDKNMIMTIVAENALRQVSSKIDPEYPMRKWLEEDMSTPGVMMHRATVALMHIVAGGSGYSKLGMYQVTLAKDLDSAAEKIAKEILSSIPAPGDAATILERGEYLKKVESAAFEKWDSVVNRYIYCLS